MSTQCIDLEGLVIRVSQIHHRKWVADAGFPMTKIRHSDMIRISQMCHRKLVAGKVRQDQTLSIWEELARFYVISLQKINVCVCTVHMHACVSMS